MMPTLTEILLEMNSTPHRLTLGWYKDMAIRVWGEGSGAVQFIDENIKKSPRGSSEPVLAPEGQMIYLLSTFDNMWNEKYYDFAGSKVKAWDRPEH